MLVAPSRVSAQREWHNERHGEQSASNHLSRSVRTMSRMGAVWKWAVVEGVTWGHRTASPEEVAERWASHRAMHSGVWVVVGPRRYRQHEDLGWEYQFRRRCIGDIAAT